MYDKWDSISKSIFIAAEKKVGKSSIIFDGFTLLIEMSVALNDHVSQWI